MHIINYIYEMCRYISSKWKTIFILSVFAFIILCILFFILWIYVSFYVLRSFKRNIDDNLYHDRFNQSSLHVLEQYGNMPIKNIYLVKKQVQYPTLFLLDAITLFKHHSFIQSQRKNKTSSYPYHVYILLELQLPKKHRKYIMIEKNNCINISTNIKIHDNQSMIKLKSTKKGLTMSKILNDIQNKIGIYTFFNWHIFKNNCQTFTKHFFDCLDIPDNVYYSFINNIHGTLFIKNIELSDFNLHTINCIINIYDFLGTLYMNWF